MALTKEQKYKVCIENELCSMMKLCGVPHDRALAHSKWFLQDWIQRRNPIKPSGFDGMYEYLWAGEDYKMTRMTEEITAKFYGTWHESMYH